MIIGLITNTYFRWSTAWIGLWSWICVNFSDSEKFLQCGGIVHDHKIMIVNFGAKTILSKILVNIARK